MRWADGLRRSVVERGRMLASLDKETLARLVDDVADTYVSAARMRGSELADAVADLKRNWKRLRDDIREAGESAEKRRSSSAED